jgi:hypothetical protein
MGKIQQFHEIIAENIMDNVNITSEENNSYNPESITVFPEHSFDSFYGDNQDIVNNSTAVPPLIEPPKKQELHTSAKPDLVSNQWQLAEKYIINSKYMIPLITCTITLMVFFFFLYHDKISDVSDLKLPVLTALTLGAVVFFFLIINSIVFLCSIGIRFLISCLKSLFKFSPKSCKQQTD